MPATLVTIDPQDIGGGGSVPYSASLGTVFPFGTLANLSGQGSLVGRLIETRLAVPYIEKWPGSPRPRIGDDASEILRTYYVPWAFWIEACKNLLGYPVIKRVGNTGYISRMLPDAFPYMLTDNFGFEPLRAFLFCTDVPEVEGIGCPPGQAPAGFYLTKDAWGVSYYLCCRLTALYKTLSYDIVDDASLPLDPNGFPDEASLKRYVTRTGQANVSYQTLPGGSFVYVSDGAICPSTPGRLEMTSDLSLAWENVPQPAVGAFEVNPYMPTLNPDGTPYIPPIAACIGRLNSLPFAGCPKGSLLLNAVVLTPIKAALGGRTFRVEYRFKKFDYQSAVSYPAPTGGFPGKAYGHCLILRTDVQLGIGRFGIGYDEVVSVSSVYGQGVSPGKPATVPTPPRIPQSNYDLISPSDNVNIFDWADMSLLFRCPVWK